MNLKLMQIRKMAATKNLQSQIAGVLCKKKLVKRYWDADICCLRKNYK